MRSKKLKLYRYTEREMLLRPAILPAVLLMSLLFGCGAGDTEHHAVNANKHTRSWPDPKAEDPTQLVLQNIGYRLGYSECRRAALWASYPLGDKRFRKWPGTRPAFREDERVNSHVTADDYWLSGYTRGHLAPGYAVWAMSGPQARVETYRMTNILPQRANLNRKLWQRLEEVAADRFTRQFEQIQVVTGPVFAKQPVYLPSGLAIPEAFYKIFAAQRDGRIWTLGFIMPQQVRGDEPLDAYVASVDEIEQRTGLDFFHWLPSDRQHQLESRVISEPWQLAAVANLPGRYQ